MKISRADFAAIKNKQMAKKVFEGSGTDAQGTPAAASGAGAAEATPSTAVPISVEVPKEVVRAKGKKRALEEGKGKAPAGSSKQRRSPPPPSTARHGAEVFLSSSIALRKKVSLPLSVAEQGVFNSEVSEGMLAALTEMQVRGYVIAKKLGQSIRQKDKNEEELRKALGEATAAKADLETKLTASNTQLSDAKSAKEKAEKKATDLGVQVEDLKKQVIALQRKNYESDMSLAEATAKVIEKDDLIKKHKERIEYLEGSLIGEHEEGFARAVRQAKYFASKGFPFGKMSFDINRDVYQGVLMDDEDIPRETEDEAAQAPPGPVGPSVP